ncbi:hypothetical protein AN958_09488 [Leucoagaricus sp. SymC.cos]|nr:hypothetical protein AN958_09488 [Leucoagaricus sp. SymC.cos]
MGESITYRVGSHWPGFRGISNLVIFGASYCDVGYHYNKERPTPSNPLGVPFPGVCWTEEGPNWVGHLITKYYPHPRFDPSLEEQSQEYMKNPLLVYNYAKGGDMVDGIERQVETPLVGKKINEGLWTAENALFVTWVDINDCGTPNVDIPTHINKLLGVQQKLYDAGARNFLLFGIPPLHRSPAGKFSFSSSGRCGFRRERADLWNSLLGKEIENFAILHEDVTASLFSPATTFNRLLDDPTRFGFDVNGATIWADHIHPTSRAHDFLAADLARFLEGISPRQPGSLG